MSDPGLRGLRSCALALPLAALLAAIGLGIAGGAAQPGGTHCDAAYCYTQTCERGSPNCRYVSERVCRPTVKQECTTQNIRKCHAVPEQVCNPHTTNECKAVRRWVCRGGGSPGSPGGSPPPAKIGSADDVIPGEVTADASQPVADVRKKSVLKRRTYYPHRRPSPRPLVQQNPNQPAQRPPAQASQQPANKPNGSSDNCYWHVRHVCTPVTKQECRSVSKEVCNYQPEQTCHNRQAQDCHDERKQVCEPGPLRCQQQQARRPCSPPQYWTPQGCVSPPAPAPAPRWTKPKDIAENAPPSTEYMKKPPKEDGGKPPTSLVKPDYKKGPDTAKLDPAPDYAPKAPKAPDPPRAKKVEPLPAKKAEPPPSAPPTAPADRRESTAPPASAPGRAPAVDVNLDGRNWRVPLDPVSIAAGAGLTLLLALLALWPKRKDIPTDADQLARLGIVLRGEPDLGGQAVTHLEKPPVGPRVTVRATPGSRRHGIVMQ